MFREKTHDRERRKYQRFTYKPQFCPILKCRKRSYRILNISAGGLKIEVFGNPNPPLFAGAVLSGFIYFANDRQLLVEGDLVWIIGNEMGIKLKSPIDQAIIKAEADYFQQESAMHTK